MLADRSLVAQRIAKDTMKNVILSTRNPSKADQVKGVFAGSPITVLTLDEAGIVGEAVEDGLTLEENALKKARYAHGCVGLGRCTMADDTGIFINALDGRPGVHAARWAGINATTDEITQYTLKQLEGTEDRRATFKTVVALVSPAGIHRFFEGEVSGVLLTAPRTKPQPKMPYSGIFKPDCSTKVWAEMTVEEENAISHRGIAFGKVREFLESGRF